MYAIKTLRRARNDFALAAVMFAGITGGALWVANSMDNGEAWDAHSRLPQTAQMQDHANLIEKIILAPCAVFPLISGLVLYRRQKKYEETKEWFAHLPKP